MSKCDQERAIGAAPCKVRRWLKRGRSSRPDGTSGFDPKGHQSCKNLVSIGCRRCGTDLFVAIALLQQANVFEDIQRFFISRMRNFHMWRPAAKLLIGCDAIGEHFFIDMCK